MGGGGNTVELVLQRKQRLKVFIKNRERSVLFPQKVLQMLVEIIKPQPFLIEFSVKKKAMEEGGKFSIFRLLEIFSNAGGKNGKLGFLSNT